MVVEHYLKKYVKHFLKDAFSQTPVLLFLMKKNHVCTSVIEVNVSMICKGVNLSMCFSYSLYYQ